MIYIELKSSVEIEWHIARQRSLVECYAPGIFYATGAKNIAANLLNSATRIWTEQDHRVMECKWDNESLLLDHTQPADLQEFFWVKLKARPLYKSITCVS
jgi:hypothetical protein